MYELLLHYYLRLYEVLILFFLAAVVGTAVLWAIQYACRSRHKTSEPPSSGEPNFDDRQYEKLYGVILSAVSHSQLEGLDFISNRCSETLGVLGEDQNILADSIKRAMVRISIMNQHALSTIEVFKPHPSVPRQVVYIKKLLAELLQELSGDERTYDVVLRDNLADVGPVGPTRLNRPLARLACHNVIHNAIRYSEKGQVIDITLSLETDDRNKARRMICVEVKDRGKGIPKDMHERIFELHKRADGLIETGHGLGLYVARRAATLQVGDVILVDSVPKQGSIFRILFPYTAMVGIEEE